MGHAGPRTWRAGSTPCDGCGRRRRSAACGQRSARPSPAAAPGAPWHNLQECRWVRQRAGRGPRPALVPAPHAQTHRPTSVPRAAGSAEQPQHLGPQENGPAGRCLSSSPLHLSARSSEREGQAKEGPSGENLKFFGDNRLNPAGGGCPHDHGQARGHCRRALTRPFTLRIRGKCLGRPGLG